jgi:hypothetical protein
MPAPTGGATILAFDAFENNLRQRLLVNLVRAVIVPATLSPFQSAKIPSAMHSFTRDTWTHEDTDRKRERLRSISDDELERELEAGNFLCRPSLRPVRLAYRIQGELARLEVCRRGAVMESCFGD